MCVCVCVCICVCVFVCVYCACVFVCVQLWLNFCVYLCVHLCVLYVCVHFLRAFVCAHVCICVSICVCVLCVCVFVCVSAYIYIYIYIYTLMSANMGIYIQNSKKTLPKYRHGVAAADVVEPGALHCQHNCFLRTQGRPGRGHLVQYEQKCGEAITSSAMRRSQITTKQQKRDCIKKKLPSV